MSSPTSDDSGGGYTPTPPGSPTLASPTLASPTLASPTNPPGSPTSEGDNSQEKEVHEWSAFYDAEGRIYYFNSTTQESSWEAPEKFNPPPPLEEEEAAEGEAKEDTEMQDAEPEAEAETEDKQAESSAEPAATAGPWVAYKDDEGREYFFNTETNQTTWDRPEDFDAAPEAPEESESPERLPSPSQQLDQESTAVDDDEMREPDSTVEEKEEEEPAEEIDPAVKRLMEAEHALNQPDAIMEPGCMNHVTEVVTSEGGNPQKAIQALIESYHGQTAICGLLGRWLSELRSQSSSSDPDDQTKLFNDAADNIREVAQDVVNKVAKERFTKTGGDSILNLSRSEATFLEDMMDSSRWRKLLIDLSASNKDSALLMYCLQAISKRGHHREIARRINQSDHFAVFNAMLASELTVVGKIAVSACRDSDTSIGLDELVSDLRRTCTSTGYTYIYAIEVLNHLVETAKDAYISAGSTKGSLFHRAVRKWERLSEELQSAMVDPSSTAGSSPLFRKRRLDVAITISELHQRQRRRIRPPEDENEEVPKLEADKRRAAVETAVLNFLRRYSLGTQVDDRILDAMLPDQLGGDSTNMIGKLLIQRPLTVKALLGYMFKPGTRRINSVVTKNKCARLIALAVLAAEELAMEEAKEINASLTSDTDEVSLSRMLSQGSQLCERLENMVSFIVGTDPGKKTAGSVSPGEQLCSLAVKCPSVAQGVGIWAREVIKGNEFVTSASYPTVSPSILSLVRIVSMKHPFTRRDALEVALGFLGHTNSEISYQKMNAIKEQSLRLLLFLAVSGEAPSVLGRVTGLLRQPGSSCMDASLIRYFVGGLLQVAREPFSVPFVRSLGRLLNAPGCSEAVRSQYFGDENKELMAKVMGTLKRMLETEADQVGLTKEDASVVKSLLSTYSKQ